MTIIIGCDPGITGCLAALNSENGELLAFCHMPTIKAASKNRVNAGALIGWLQSILEMGDHVEAVLELVGAMPRQSPAAMFSFGHAAGILEGAVMGAGIPLHLVTPTEWKRRAGLHGTEKDAARAVCARLYPGVRELDKIQKGQALADAIMIARHGIKN